MIVVTDEDALNGHVRLESWDGEAAFDPMPGTALRSLT